MSCVADKFILPWFIGRLVLGFVIGKHDQAHADRLVEQVTWVTDGTIPFFTSDQGSVYPHALLKIYGEWYSVRPAVGPVVLIPNPDDDRLPTCCMPK